MALSNKITYESIFDEHKPKMPLTRADKERIQAMIRKAKNEFAYSWELSSTVIRSIKQLVPLTLLTSFLVTILEAMNILHGVFMTERKATGMVQLFEAASDLLIWLLWGAAISLVLLIISSYFEALLISRKNYWKRYMSALRRDMRNMI